MLSFAYFLVIALGFGSSFALMNIAVGSLAPVWMAAARAVIAALVAGAFVLATRRKVRLDWRLIGIFALLGFTNAALPFTALGWSQRMIGSGLAGVLFASMPMFTLLLGPLIVPGEKIRGTQLAGALVGMAGVAVATLSDAAGTGSTAIAAQTASAASEGGVDMTALFGAALTLFAAMCYATGGLIVRRLPAVDMPVLTTGQLAMGGAMLSVVAMAQAGAPVEAFGAMPQHAALALLALGVVCTAAPMLAVFLLIRREGAARASLAAFSMPFVAMLIGAVFLSEPVTWALLAGLMLVLLGAALVIRG